MKTTASITKITLGLLIAGSIAACNQNKNAAPAGTSAAASGSSASGIVFFNQDSLLSKYDYVKDMSKRLEEKGKAAQSDLSSKEQAFQREVAEYQRGQATLSADQRQTTEQRLQRKGQELQGYKQNATAEFQNSQSAETNKLYDKLADYAKKFAKEKGYKLVLAFTKTNPTVLYGDPSLDVTTEMLKGLNADYTKDKK